MALERSNFYRPYTWELMAPRVQGLSYDELLDLAWRARVELSLDKDELSDNILSRGGFLIVEYGLTSDPKVMRGTIFTDKVYEYIIYEDAAKQLSAGEAVTIRYIGGTYVAMFTPEKVIQALRVSESFAQVERW